MYTTKQPFTMSGDDINQLYEQLGFLFCKRQRKGTYAIMVATKAVVPLLGYSLEDFLAKKNFAKLIHPEDLPHFESQLQKSIDQKTSYSINYRLKHKNGDYIFIEEKGVVQTKGKSTYLEGILSAKETTDSSTEDFEQLFNNATEGIIVHDNNVVQVANAAFYKLFGQQPEDIIGQDITQRIPKNSSDPNIDKILSKLEKDKQLAYQQIIWFVGKDGRRVFVSISAKPLVYKGKQMRSVMFRNITREVEMHTELENSREKYRVFAEASQEGVIIHDKGVTVEVNQKVCDMLGYTADELINQPVSILVIPEEMPKVAQFLRENEKNKENKRYDLIRALHKSGKMIQVAIWVSGIELYGEKLRYILVRDITEELNAQEELRQSHQKYKRLSDITEEMIMVHDNGIIVEVNKATCDFYNLSEEELIGMHTFDLMPQKTIQEYGLSKEILEAVYKGDTISEGINEKEKNGEKIFCQYKESIFYVGGRRLRYVMMRNITEIQVAQQQLEDSRNKFKHLADASHEMILIHDNGKLVEANRAFCETVGCEEEDIIGKVLS